MFMYIRENHNFPALMRNKGNAVIKSSSFLKVISTRASCYFASYKIYMHHTSVCLIFMYRHTNPFILSSSSSSSSSLKDFHQRTWECNKRQSEEVNKSQMWNGFLFQFRTASAFSLGDFDTKNHRRVRSLRWHHLNIVHVVNCVISWALGCVSHECPGALYSKTKNPVGILSRFLRRKGKANDGTQMQKSFGYIFDALLLWIADSPFLFHIGLVYRAAIYFIFSQA